MNRRWEISLIVAPPLLGLVAFGLWSAFQAQVAQSEKTTAEAAVLAYLRSIAVQPESVELVLLEPPMSAAGAQIYSAPAESAQAMHWREVGRDVFAENPPSAVVHAVFRGRTRAGAATLDERMFFLRGVAVLIAVPLDSYRPAPR